MRHRTSPEDNERFTNIKYRADVDGLRAVAVLLIVLFHAYPSLMPKGFIGVDIFFVVSGYLISTIVYVGVELGTFTFTEFYSRRIRRILPSLILVLLSCLLFGWYILLEGEYQQLGKHVFSGASFISNFSLWRESGYFDYAANRKPLLHLWSLGIEEQFYIFFPLSCWFLRRKKRDLLIMIFLSALSSFFLNLSKIYSDPVAVFYLPQYRIWETLSGCILAYFTLNNSKFLNHFRSSWFSLIGGSFILLALFIIPEKYFPGYWALLPVMGTLLIIIAGPSAWFNRLVLSNRVLVWLGLISFPLYLWHWPLLSFARILESTRITNLSGTVIIFISIFLAWITHELLERPFQYGENLRFKTVILIFLLIAVGFFGGGFFLSNGIPSRAVVRMNTNASLGFDGGTHTFSTNGCGLKSESEKKTFKVCAQDARQTPRFALVGDSKAEALYAGLVRTSFENGRWLFIGGNTADGAPVPVLSDKNMYKIYQKYIKIALKSIMQNKNIDTVVFVAATRILFNLNTADSIDDLPATKNEEIAFDGMRNVASLLVQHGKKVVLVIDNPTLPEPLDCMERRTSLPIINRIYPPHLNPRCQVSINRHLELTKKYRDLLFKIQSIEPRKIKIFDTLKYMCDEQRGSCTAYRNGRPLYSYSDHISDYAAGLIGRDLNIFLMKI